MAEVSPKSWAHCRQAGLSVGSRAACTCASMSGRPSSMSDQVDVVVVERLAVDAVTRRRDPGRDLAAFVDRLHQRADMDLVHVGRQPLALAPLPLLARDELAARGGLDARERADLAVEGDVRQPQPLVEPGGGQDAVPAVDPGLAVRDVLPAQVGIQPGQRGPLSLAALALAGEGILRDRFAGEVVVVPAAAL